GPRAHPRLAHDGWAARGYTRVGGRGHDDGSRCVSFLAAHRERHPYRSAPEPSGEVPDRDVFVRHDEWSDDESELGWNRRSGVHLVRIVMVLLNIPIRSSHPRGFARVLA